MRDRVANATLEIIDVYIQVITSACRCDDLYVNSFFIVIVATYFMKQKSTIHSVHTGLIYAVLQLSFSKQYKIQSFDLLLQCGPTTCPRAACGPPQRFQWPGEAFRKNLQI